MARTQRNHRYYAPTVAVDEASPTEVPRLDEKYGTCAKCKRGATHSHSFGSAMTIFACAECKYAWPQTVRFRNPFAGYALGTPLRPDRHRTLSALLEQRGEIDAMIAAVKAS